MDQDNDALAFGRAHIAAAIAVFASTLLWASLLGMASIGANDLFTFKIQFALEKLFSANAQFFLLTFPIPTAIIAALAKHLNKTSLIITATIPTLIALIAAMAIYPTLQSLWVLAIFYTGAVPFAVEKASSSYKELKSLITTRAMLGTMGKTITLASIGIIALSAATILPNQQQYTEKFENSLTELAGNIATGESMQNAAAGNADTIIQNQTAALEEITKSTAYQKLKTKFDPDVIAFTMAVDATASYIKSPEYRQKVEEQLSRATGSAIQNLDIVGLIKSQFPFFATIEKFLWLLHALTIAGIFSLAANIICKPLTAAYGHTTQLIITILGKK